ncbi:IclR family transcriptional regulator [Lentzea sp. NPDC059081]|uniref:IclR family transcriptional regulator n=1 Tax=Lentzea sp. NPDC059081 TaxID=3346719 RepID=UPI003694048F
MVQPASEHETTRSTGTARGRLWKVVAVVEVLAAAAAPLSLSELVEVVPLPKSTLHRLMRHLMEIGLVAQTESKRYELGDYLQRLAKQSGPARAYDVSCAITPFLLELFRATRHVVSVAVLSGGEVHHAGLLYDHDHARVAKALRQPMPAHCSAAGKLLLANGSRSAPEPSFAHTPWTIVHEDVLRRELSLIRRTGLSYARGEYLPELFEVAAPVYLGSADPVAAVVVSGTIERMDPHSVGRVLAGVVASIEKHADLTETA